VLELSQVTYSPSSAGKIVIDKTPDGARSPNLADSVLIAFSPTPRGLEDWIRLGVAP
jgi:phage terminase large subunit